MPAVLPAHSCGERALQAALRWAALLALPPASEERRSEVIPHVPTS